VSVTIATWVVAITGLALICLLSGFQAVAVLRPRGAWTIANVYGGSPESTDPAAYFAFNQGFARADLFVWAPLQIAGSIGMLVGQEWGFLLALAASVPYIYTAILFFIWDRDLGFRKNTFSYWIIVWAIWPVFGTVEAIYTFSRLSN
jgi:hypothetical protein